MDLQHGPSPRSFFTFSVCPVTKPVVYFQVNYFNEVLAVWEPLLERVDRGQRRWNLELEVTVSLE